MTSLNKNKDGVRLIQINLNMLNRLRGYDTDSRESTFNYDGTKRFGDFDDGWKRYHWCKSQFLGYEDEASTYYVVLGAMGSVKIIFDHTLGIVNRLDYDRLGNLRNSDTSPQIELLFKKSYYNSETGLYIGEKGVYDPTLGDFVIPDYNAPSGGGLCDHSSGGGGSWPPGDSGGGGTWTWGNCESSPLGWYARYHFDWSEVWDWASDWMADHHLETGLIDIVGISIVGVLVPGALPSLIISIVGGGGELISLEYTGTFVGCHWQKWLSGTSRRFGEFICDHI